MQSPTNHRFKISEAGFKKFRKKWLTIMIPLMIVGVTIVIVTNSLTTKTGEVNILPYFIPIVIVFFSFSIYRSLRKQKKFLLSYSVTVSDEGITREQLNTPPLSISSIEIKEIIKTKKGGFRINGVGRTDVIHIPYMIDNGQVLEERLQTLAPISYNPKTSLSKSYGSFLALLGVGLLITVNTVDNKIVVGVCGVVLIGLIIWGLYEIQTNKNIPTNIKRRSWLLIAMIFLVLYVMMIKLTGFGIPY